MALDSYAMCPGGRDQKIRFCCPNLLKELEQIQEMMENDQMSACLSFIEKLEQTHPDCACLSMAKCTILRSLDRWEDALSVVTTLVDKEPANMAAKTEKALILSVLGQIHEAVSVLVDAIELNEKGKLHTSIPFAMYAVGQALLENGMILSATALAKQLQSYVPDNPQSADLLRRCLMDRQNPLILKELTLDRRSPETFSGKEIYGEALGWIRSGYWKRGLALLESLLPAGEEWPNLYRSIAIVRFWLMNEEGAMEMLEKFIAASSPNDEETADAQTVLDYLDSSQLIGNLIHNKRTLTLSDVNRAQELLLSSKAFLNTPYPYPAAQDAPPPKNVFALLNKPYDQSVSEWTYENASYSLGVLFLFGAETDRPARIELIAATPADEDEAVASVKSLLGDLIQSEETTFLEFFSEIDQKLYRQFSFPPHQIPDQDAQNHLYEEYLLHVFVPEVCHLSLGLLDDQSALEAAADPGKRHKLEAFLNVLQEKIPPLFLDDVMGALRAYLSLAPLPPIEIPKDLEPEQFAEFMSTVPAWRWYRLNVEQLGTDQLVHFLPIVQMLNDRRASKRVAAEVLNRSLSDTPPSIRHLAFNVLISQALEFFLVDQAKDWVAKARNEADELNQSDAQWDIADLMIGEQTQDVEQSSKTLKHLMDQHRNEPEIMRDLQTLLIRWGFINPDGSPNYRAQAATAQASSTAPSEQGQSGLWTPGSDSPSSDKGGSKLWTPDSM